MKRQISTKIITKEKYVYNYKEILELIKNDIQKNKLKSTFPVINSKIKMYALTNEPDEIPIYLDDEFSYHSLLVTVESESLVQGLNIDDP